MARGCKKSGVKKIRVHDVRHSYASLLIELGFSPLLISERLGHENVETTLETYTHLYPDKMEQVAADLDRQAASKSEAPDSVISDLEKAEKEHKK